ncbi:MAG: bacterioferritin [Nitrospira sp.]|nr:bacterioferritin [Nitrospira sp.]MCP9462267.1 bacterioferritin [Nitrospira sp.]MCP9474476.1 bacterioferritin [Nitrospira sp.]
MKAKEGVVEYLNQVLKAELTAVHQYMLHAALCKQWGYERLSEHFERLVHEEVEHSSGLLDHILYLEGTPEVDGVGAVASGRTVQELFVGDLDFERADAELLRKAIAQCADAGDFTTRHTLEDMIVDTEEHIDWFETQLRAIEQIGLDRYLGEQIKR